MGGGIVMACRPTLPLPEGARVRWGGYWYKVGIFETPKLTSGERFYGSRWRTSVCVGDSGRPTRWARAPAVRIADAVICGNSVTVIARELAYHARWASRGTVAQLYSGATAQLHNRRPCAGRAIAGRGRRAPRRVVLRLAMDATAH
jgi:hypothetical protein